MALLGFRWRGVALLVGQAGHARVGLRALLGYGVGPACGEGEASGPREVLGRWWWPVGLRRREARWADWPHGLAHGGGEMVGWLG
jgi:hypothetical protein